MWQRSCQLYIAGLSLMRCESSAFVPSVPTTASARALTVQPNKILVLSKDYPCGLGIRRTVSIVTMQAQHALAQESPNKKKVVVIGAGWAGLAAAHELSKQVSGLAEIPTACGCSCTSRLKHSVVPLFVTDTTRSRVRHCSMVTRVPC